MNQLYWKEWREQRMIMLAMPIICFVLLIGYSVLKGTGLLDGSQQHTPALDGEAAFGCLMFTWLMSAAVCGAQVMAPEVNSGTLRFLSILPMTRGALWRGKVLAGVVSTAACLAGATLICLLVCAIMERIHQFDTPVGQLFNGIATGSIGGTAVFLLCVAALVFSVGSYVTMLLEKTINAVLATVVASVAIYALLGLVVSKLPLSPDNPNTSFYVLEGLSSLIAALLLWMSCRTFELGETLQTSTRFLFLRWPSRIGDIALIAVALMVAYLWIMA